MSNQLNYIVILFLLGAHVCQSLPIYMGIDERGNHKFRKTHGVLREFGAGDLLDGVYPPPTLYFKQTVDHFNSQNDDTYNQRYWINKDYWDQNSGPIFLYIEGESAGSGYDVMMGHHVEMAKTYKAMVIAVEHRFYGLSVPYNDLSTEHLSFLSSQQALADLAEFISTFKTEMNLGNRKWISFGGSYPGSLSAWMRLKYPHLIYAAVSSSSPVKAELNFEGYNEVVANSLAMDTIGGSSACASSIKTAFLSIQSLLTSSAGKSQLDGMFSTSPKIVDASEFDLSTFLGNVGGLFMGVVQYNDETGGLNVEQVCKTMLQNGSDPLNSLASLIAQNTEGVMQISWNATIEALKNITVNEHSMERQWYYQTCGQFGYYQTCDGNTSCLFQNSDLFDLRFSLDFCQEIYGFDFSEVYDRVDFSNDYYGADNLDGSRILFVNGDVDPWHVLSVLSDIPDTSITSILIHGTAHCANMMSSKSSDPPELIEARKKIEYQVGAWVSS